jgi:hypothetical protein
MLKINLSKVYKTLKIKSMRSHFYSTFLETILNSEPKEIIQYLQRIGLLKLNVRCEN